MKKISFTWKLLFIFISFLSFFSFVIPTTSPKAYAEDLYGCKCDDPGKSASFSCDGKKQTCEKASDGHVCWQQAGKASNNGQKGGAADVIFGSGKEDITVHDVYCSSKDQGPKGTVDSNDWNNCKCTPDGKGFTCDGGKKDTCEKSDRDRCINVPGSDTKNKNKDKDGKEYNIIGVVCADKSNTWTQCKCDTPNVQGKNGFSCADDPSHHSSCNNPNQACVDRKGVQGNTTESKGGKQIGMIDVFCTDPIWTGCTCDKENDPQKNTFKCKLNGKEKTGKCEPDNGCGKLPDAKRTTTNKVDGKNVSLEGIQCVGKEDIIKAKERKKDPTLPPPPLPPCIRFDGDGRCLAVQTSFANERLGEFPTDATQFITRIFALLLGLSGGIGTILIMRSGYVIMTSQGKPEALQKGREELIAAIVGLVFLILSFVALQVIGVDILHIPEFK